MSSTRVSLPESARRDFDEKGYFITEPMFDLEELELVRAEIERIWAEKRTWGATHDRPGRQAFTVTRPELQRLHLASDRLASFIRSEPYVAIARLLLGDDADVFWNQSYTKKDHGGVRTSIPWHQDAHYATLTARSYNCWTAITRTTIENGTVWFVEAPPGRALLPHTWDTDTLFFRCEIDAASEIPVALEPGQIFVFDGFLPHRSGANLSEETRVTYSVSFCAKDTRLAINNEPFGDRIPLLRGGRRADDLIVDLATSNDERDHPGRAVLAEIAARVPEKRDEIAKLVDSVRAAITARDNAQVSALVNRLLALRPDEGDVLGDELGARGQIDQIMEEVRRVASTDPGSARALLRRALQLVPTHAEALATLERLH